jgi:uncharacterized protein
MDYVALGRSNLLVSRTAFGGLALNGTTDYESAARLVSLAYEGGINFYDTSHTAPESERLLGAATHVFRTDIVLATKSAARSVQELRLDLDESLESLQTSYIDLYQLENPRVMPVSGGADGLYDALCALKTGGKIRHIGIATDSMELAASVLASGSSLWETIQFPFNILCGNATEELVKKCAGTDTGFIAMQPLCGGVITNIPLALGYLHQFESVVPVWGARTSEELEQILYFTANPPVIDDKFNEEAEKVRAFFN